MPDSTADLCVVYALSLDGVTYRYVGQTCRGARDRLARHRNVARRNKTRMPVHHWMRKHADDDVVLTVLEVCERDDLRQRERYWIAKLRTDGCRLLNLTDGGEGGPGWRRSPTPEQRAKISATLTGRKNGPPSEETRRKIGDAHRGRKISPAQIEALRMAALGRTPWNKGLEMSAEHRRKLSQSHIGLPSARKGVVLTDAERAAVSAATRAGMAELGYGAWRKVPALCPGCGVTFTQAGSKPRMTCSAICRGKVQAASRLATLAAKKDAGAA